MREELKNQQWHGVGLSEDDFDYTLRLVKDMIKARYENLNLFADKIHKEKPLLATDILDDITYYTWVDIQYFWHFCLWRLQAIFEGLITECFLSHLPKKNMIGLKSKLTAMKAAGYNIEHLLFDEVLEWGNLRNGLSHCPPEQFHPGLLKQDDIEEYLNLLKTIVATWRKEEIAIKAVI